jgi:serine/threonine protein kinase
MSSAVPSSDANVFYRLGSDDPLGTLRDALRLPAGVARRDTGSSDEDLEAALWDHFERFVRDAFLSDDVLPDVARALARLQNDERAPSSLKGIVGLALFLQTLDWSMHRSRGWDDESWADFERLLYDELGLRGDLRSLLSGLLQLPEVLKYFSRWYRLDSVDEVPLDLLSGAKVANFGTTSFIVKCIHTGVKLPWALKCILPRYVDSREITRATRNYKRAVERVPDNIAPAVVQSSERWVLMNWVEGETLADSLLLNRPEPRSQPRAGDEEEKIIRLPTAYEALEQFALRLVAILNDLDKLGLSHLDISPKNIMVDRETNKLTLIDFGENFLIRNRASVGTARAFASAALYVAPEIRRDSGDAPRPLLAGTDDEKSVVRADLYSLGVVFLQVLSGGRLTEANMNVQMKALWEASPGWARLVEDLIAREPEDRLCMMPRTERWKYEYVRSAIQNQQDLNRIFEIDKSGREPAGSPRRFRWWAVRSFDAPSRLAMAARDYDGEANSWARDRGVVWWSFWSIGLWAFTLALFLVFANADLGEPNGVAEMIHSLFGGHLKYHIGPIDGHYWKTFATNEPGRFVALTFGMCAAAYYMNIFATLSLKGINGWLPWFARMFMRGCAWFPWIPILICILVAPHWWPYMSAAGTIVVIGNNYCMWRIAERAAAVEPPLDEDFLRYYGEWWRLMALLGVFLLGTGAFIDLGWVPNSWFFGVAVALGVNYAKLYRSNSLKFAAPVRGNLDRAIFMIRREQARGRSHAARERRLFEIPGRRVSIVVEDFRATPDELAGARPVRPSGGRRERAKVWAASGTVAAMCGGGVGIAVAHGGGWFGLMTGVLVGSLCLGSIRSAMSDGLRGVRGRLRT